MKNKIILPALIVSVIAISVFTAVYASTNENISNFTKMLTKKQISVDESYVKTDSKTNALNSPDILSKSNDILSKLNISNKKIDLNNSKVTQYKNELESRTETIISNDEFSIQLNSDTGEFLSYISNKVLFEKNSLSNEEIKNKAIEIFKKLNISDSDKYELNYLTKFDDEIWRVGFVKKYDDLINPQENIKFSFAPQTNEIVTLALNSIKYDNNEVLVTEENAEKIADEYLVKSKADKMSMSIEIVRPNYFYEGKAESEKVYTKVNRARKAYVFTFNNDSQSKVYIDCTTGEVIGGDMLQGGEF